ncbi:hypothetical protein CRUP_012606 [Coryphaenoides rupestris]|nr:hypothetical protein CRUP_012606 [Coryphaenoides rupestris]
MRNGLFMASHRLGAKMVWGLHHPVPDARWRSASPVEIRTKVVGWDGEGLLFGTSALCPRGTASISAVMLCRQNVVRCSPEKINRITCPEFPEDLKHWINYISASSQALRAESGLEKKDE